MFYGQCWKCGERWNLGTASTCTCEPEQPQHTWVGLTDDEITDIWAGSSPYYHEDDFARAVEAKLKEKNT